MSDSYDNPELVEKVCRMICSVRGQDADSMVFPEGWIFYTSALGWSEMPSNLPLQPLWTVFKEDAESAISAVRNWDYYEQEKK